MTTDADRPAYPFEWTELRAFDDSSDRQAVRHVHEGLTKRELIAAMCMQGLIAGPEFPPSLTAAGQWAVRAADALLAELAKPKGTP